MACWHTYIYQLDNGCLFVNPGTRERGYAGKFWVAELRGRCEKYLFERKFINNYEGAVISGAGVYQVFRDILKYRNSARDRPKPETYFLEVRHDMSWQLHDQLTPEEVLIMRRQLRLHQLLSSSK
jgi:hypothetical protein